MNSPTFGFRQRLVVVGAAILVATASHSPQRDTRAPAPPSPPLSFHLAIEGAMDLQVQVPLPFH
jgi:hypothetical protein